MGGRTTMQLALNSNLPLDKVVVVDVSPVNQVAITLNTKQNTKWSGIWRDLKQPVEHGTFLPLLEGGHLRPEPEYFRYDTLSQPVQHWEWCSCEKICGQAAFWEDKGWSLLHSSAMLYCATMEYNMLHILAYMNTSFWTFNCTCGSAGRSKRDLHSSSCCCC